MPRPDTLHTLWLDALELTHCPPDDTFMALGGDSLAAMQLCARLKSELGLDLGVDPLLNGLSLTGLRQWASTQGEQASMVALTPLPITRQRRDQWLPLSHSQRRMWLTQQFAPDSTAYHVPFALRLQGPLDTECLHQALSTVWHRHDTFRTRFVLTAQGPQQEVLPSDDLTVPMSRHVLHSQGSDTALPGEAEERARQTLRTLCRQPFDLQQGPLWRIALLELGPRDHVIAWFAHHILIDLAANLIVAQEVASVYQQLLMGRQPHLPPVQIDCADHGYWQTSPDMQARLAPQLHHWSRLIQDMPPLRLPTDHPMTAQWYREGGRITTPLPAGLAERLHQLATREGGTPFMVLLAALSLMLGRHAGQEDVAIATPIANRHHAETSRIVASLVNTLVMRTDLSGDPSFLTLLQRVKAQALLAYANQDLPFDLLVERHGQHQRQADLPLGLNVMLNVTNAAHGKTVFEGLHTSRFLFDRGAAQFPLAFIADLEHSQTISLEYAASLFEPASAESLLQNYLAVLTQVLDRPERPLSDHHWRSALDQAHWQEAHAATHPPLPEDGCTGVDQLLARQAALHPRAVALRHGDQVLSYGELQAQAMAMCQHLTRRGIGPGHRVGLSLERGPHLVVALWAVLASGAAYVPLDPHYPSARLQDMIDDAGLSLLLTQPELATRLPSGRVPVLTLGQSDPAPSQASAPGTAPARQGDDPAYLIYTSGSTGRPKGVVVPHRAVLNFLRSMAHTPGLARNDRLLAVTTLSFDIAVLELLLPLSVGAQVVIASQDDVLDGQALARLIDTQRVTAMQATPSTWRLLIDAGWNGQGRRRFKALVGGEALQSDLATQLIQRCPAVWNMYGPTETTVWSSCARISGQPPDVHIGRPIDHTRLHVLDHTGHPSPVGVPGELFIGGDGVALGYWQRPDLSQTRFVPEPGHPGHLMYRTGDLARWRRDGQLEHLGRLDHQIKVRGHRIEPGDIESCLQQHPDVGRCVLVAREDRPGDVRLVAYVVPGLPGQTAKAADLRAHCRQHLPEHMVPQRFVCLPDGLPLLANGKLDRQALPPPSSHDLEAPAAGDTLTDASPMLRALAETWRTLLGVNDLRPQDNFFDLGGHSLLAIQGIGLMAERTGLRVGARHYIFESLAQLAQTYEHAASTSTAMHPLTTQEPAASGLDSPPRAQRLLHRLLKGRGRSTG
ncbi:amino acid adenylation domain-containing protein [Aquabacterium sp.]|uniref:non-ribosomal peptide synthetase n=1 Tax=Aquabacterium sp. TaxID=1872578 RepID=UPI0025C1C68F|nr:amino acid adenylation domain-containing protein [Aquabacterium sp.]